MDILNSSLAQNYKPLAIEIKDMLEEAQKLGAVVSVQRMELVCEQYDKISPDIAYQWLDLDGFQHEIEEAQTHKKRIEIITFMRNVFSLAPLIATWVALFLAVDTYQKNLIIHPDDKYIPFLQQWQDGFHGATWFTFTVTAGLDVLFLSLYLIAILVGHGLERRALSDATKFVYRLRFTTDKLMEVIAAANITPIRAPADIDKVTIAIKQVVDSATEASKQLAKTTEQAIQQIVQTVTPLLVNFDTNTSTFQNQLTTFQTQLVDLTKNTQQLAGDSAIMAKHAQSYVTLSQDINSHMATLSQAEQAMVQQLTSISDGFNTAVGSLANVTTGMQQVSASVTTSAQALDNNVQLVTTKLTDSVDRATAFQSQLADFYSQLSNLNVVIQQIADTSTTLVTNAQNYVTVGQSIDKQIAHLDSTEQNILVQLQSVSGNMDITSHRMDTATTSLQEVSGSVGSIEQSLTSGVNKTVDQMTINITRATAALGQVENQLGVTTAVLQQAAEQLSSFALGQVENQLGFTTAALQQVAEQLSSFQITVGNNNQNGFVGWMFQRSTRRSKPQKTKATRP